MTWITMCDGVELSLKYLTDLHTITVEQLAHNIAQQVRFSGAAIRPVSVAEHSLLVHDIASKHLGLNIHGQFFALCRSLHMGLTGVLDPAQAEEAGAGWTAFEHHIEHALALRLGMVTPKHQHMVDVIVADRMATAMERDQLMPTHQPNGALSTPTPGLARIPLLRDVNLMHPARVTCTWEDWRDAFLERFHELDAARRQASLPKPLETAR